MKVYFSDWFNISPDVLEEYGAFNVSLVNDLPLFIDPFLLFTSEKQPYRELHDRMISYLRFLRDQSASGHVTEGLLRAWYMFPEVKQLWPGLQPAGQWRQWPRNGFRMCVERESECYLQGFWGRENR